MILRDVRVTVGDRDLLSGANLRVEPGECVGLVGANGCGKSTLLRCVAGAREVSGGDLLVSPRADVGYLEQTAVSGSSRTVAQEARSRMTHVIDAESALRAAEEAIAAGDVNGATMMVAARDRFEAIGGDAVERRVADVLNGLGFAREAWDRPCDALSGGWQMRVALARLLLSPAGDCQSGGGVNGGFLLLDEPTNHLDASAKEYLAGWLRAYKGTTLLVSHDEALLEKGVDRLIEVRGGRLRGYSGNYSKFVEERSERRRVNQAAATKEKAKAAKLAQFVAKNSARASTAAAARSRAKQLEGVNARLEEMREDGDLDDKALGAGPGDAKRVTLRLPPAPDGAKEVLTLTNATIGYGGGLSPLINDVDLVVRRGDRLLVVGPNGAGKSTLLRSLGGSLRLQGGVLAHGEGARVGYFSQDLAQELPSDVPPLTHVLKVARAANPTLNEQTARSVLGALGLGGNAAKDRVIGDLSGGEKARVALAAFVLRPVNVLLLDEASNHLDAAAIEALTEGLRDWDGAVVAVTHNEAFADALEPTFVARVENGGMKSRMVVGGALSKRDFSATAMVSTGGVAGAVREDAGAGAKAKAKAKANEGLSEEEIAAREAEARANAAAVAKMLKEARNAPSVIAKIERALAVIDDDIAAIDERLLACGADVAAAQEIQREKDKKTEKQTLYYEEWERLEAVMEEAKAHGGGA